MKQSKSEKFSFIIYQGKRVPRFMQLNASTLRLATYGAPLIVLVSLIATSSVFYYMDVLKTNVERQEPSVLNELRQKNAELELSLAEKTELVNELQQKQVTLVAPVTADTSAPTSSSPAKTGSDISHSLGLFRAMGNVQDLTASSLFNIDQINAFSDQKNLHVRFNIVNNNQSEKRSGHVWVMVRHGDELQIYPSQNVGQEEFQLKYFDGEPFATSRFRPVDATFHLPQKATDNILIKILIFNRSGDLIFHQVTHKPLGI